MRSAYIPLSVEQEQPWLENKSKNISVSNGGRSTYSDIISVVSRKAVETATTSEAVITIKGSTTEVDEAETIIPAR